MNIEHNGKIKYDFSKLEKLMKKLKTKYYVDIGILGGASYENGATIAGVGAVHEFGRIDGSIPKRSFIIMPIEDHQSEIAEKIKGKFKEYIEKNDIKGIFTLLGIECEHWIQEAFDTGGFGTWEANADITIKGGWMTKNGKSFFIKGKKSDSPLIDEGDLSKSITIEVRSGK